MIDPEQGIAGSAGPQGRQGEPGKNPRVTWRDFWLVGITVILLVVVLQLRSTTNSVSAGLENQTSNRAKNVSVWCDAINKERGVIVAYVAAIPGAPPVKLGQLPCAKLEKATTLSTRPARHAAKHS